MDLKVRFDMQRMIQVSVGLIQGFSQICRKQIEVSFDVEDDRSGLKIEYYD